MQPATPIAPSLAELESRAAGGDLAAKVAYGVGLIAAGRDADGMALLRDAAAAGDAEAFRQLAVHRATDAVTGVIADDSVTVFFGVRLNRVPDVADALARITLLNRQIETFFRDANQLFQIVRNLADRRGERGVADKTVVSRRHIERDDVAVLQGNVV